MFKLRIASALAASVLGLLLVTVPLGAANCQATDQQLDALLADIGQRTDRYSRFRSLLADPDQAKRMAAFSGMMNSGILTLQDMALEYAFNSGDAAMQTVALRLLLIRTNVLSFDIELDGQYSETTKNALRRLNGGFAINIKEWNPSTGAFTGWDSAGTRSGSGQLNGLSLQYSSPSCRTSILLDDTSRTMTGSISCTNFAEPVKLSLTIR